MPQVIPQLINGQWQASNARELIEVTDPATQEVLALAPKATHEKSRRPSPAPSRPSSAGAKSRCRNVLG